MINGQCLCGNIHFQIQQKKIETIYQCHCSLCRKQSGTHANHATMIKAESFIWLKGQDQIRTYKKETGFTSSFCQNCGSPVPNYIGTHPYLWIPLGLIEHDIEPQQRLNFCISSKVTWANLQHSIDYNEVPSWDTLKEFFKLNSK